MVVKHASYFFQRMFSLRSLGKSLVTELNRTRIVPPLTFTGLPKIETYLKPEVLISFQVREANRSCIADLRKDFNWKKERPLGPHLHRPPNKAGVRAAENYRHIIHYPEDGKYTIKKLDSTDWF